MRKYKGFTLIELMIVVVIISILAGIAYPAYQDSVRKSRRSDGTSALLQAAQILERCYTELNTYSAPRVPASLLLAQTGGCSIVGAGPAINTLTGAGLLAGSGYYNITSVPAATTYTLTATPQALGGQNNDSCGTYTLTNTGVRTPATAGCW